jgi:hypothetical protein
MGHAMDPHGQLGPTARVGMSLINARDHAHIAAL